MAKRKQKTESSDHDAVVELQEPVPAKEYTVGGWAGHAHYQCSLCPFDVLDDEAMVIQHIRMRHHPRPIKRSPSSVLVADKRGNDVTDQVAEEGDLNNMFEVELKEVGSSTDEQGNEHKTYTIKE